jgi:hypothetical protein
LRTAVVFGAVRCEGKGTQLSSSSKFIDTIQVLKGSAMDKKDIQDKIRYSSIAEAREKGIISKEEAEFMLDEYMKAYKEAQPRPKN